MLNILYVFVFIYYIKWNLLNPGSSAKQYKAALNHISVSTRINACYCTMHTLIHNNIYRQQHISSFSLI